MSGLEQQYGISACSDVNIHCKCTSMETGQIDASVPVSVITKEDHDIDDSHKASILAENAVTLLKLI
jgi:hypothetical protein